MVMALAARYTDLTLREIGDKMGAMHYQAVSQRFGESTHVLSENRPCGDGSKRSAVPAKPELSNVET